MAITKITYTAKETKSYYREPIGRESNFRNLDDTLYEQTKMLNKYRNFIEAMYDFPDAKARDLIRRVFDRDPVPTEKTKKKRTYHVANLIIHEED